MRSAKPLFFSVVLLLVVGCGMPETPPPVIEGTLDSSTASARQAKIRAANGESFQVEHEFEGKTFTANWLLGNALKKTSQLQLKPPAEWSDVELYQALEVVLNSYDTKPWYNNIDDTVLKLTRRAMQSDSGVASDFAPDTPYEVSTKVKKHSQEWFLQVEVVIYNQDGTAIGF